MNKILLTLLPLLIFSTLRAQTVQVVSGKVMNEKNEPLSGVSVNVVGQPGGTTTDVEGRFLLRLESGKPHRLNFSSIGYAKKEISDLTTTNAKEQELTIVMETENKVLNMVVVTTSARKESDNALLSMQKNNASISDGISSETIKRSPDRNTGEVLKRVSGTSIQDNKFVVVRGLIDRYNIATINNAILPSSEPDRRAFSFDIIPSNLIDNILIFKTANPDLPGDFSGGVVQVSTKDVPNTNFFSIGAGLGYNTNSTGRDFNPGYVGSTDYFGFDDGSRSLPSGFPSRKHFQGQNFSTRASYSRLLKNTYGDRYSGNALPSQSYQLSWGHRYNLKSGGVIGSILAVSYRNSQTIIDGERVEYDNQFSQTNGAAYLYNDSTHRFITSIGGILNVAYKKGNNKIALKNLFNRLFENGNLLRQGTQYYSSYAGLTAQGAETVIKTLLSSQLEGEHSFADRSKFTWNLNYALTLRDNPDYRFAPFIKDSSDAGKPNVPAEVVLRDTYRFYSNLSDHAFGGSANYNFPFKLFSERPSTAKFGVLSQYKVRGFAARIFRYNQSSGSHFNEAILQLPLRQIFSRANMYDNGLALEEITNNTDRYDATSDLNAGYAMLDNRLGERFRLVWGARVESFGFRVNTSDFSGEKVSVTKRYLDVLPSVNFTYNVTEQSNLRLSASRTVSRPEFREVANFSFYDFVRNVIVRGNTNLTRSQNTNVDLRYEVYPSNGEVVSVSVFAKHFNRPIELRADPGSNPLNIFFEYYNAKSALNYGIEAEIKKRLSFLGEQAWLENFYVFANASFIRSRVSVKGLDVSVADQNRPMQGQSPYLINAGITYNSPASDLAVSALFNRIGHRVDAVGFDAVGLPDIYENGRSIVDLQISKRLFKKKGEIKLNLSDLLNQRSIFYQNYAMDNGVSNKRSFNRSEDRVWASYRYGTNVSLNFSYNL